MTRGKGIVTKRSLEAGLTHIEELLDAGLTPVLHGDAVLDEVQGCSILSGDTLMVLLVIIRAIIISLLIYLMEEMNALPGERVDHIWVQWEDIVVGPVR